MIPPDLSEGACVGKDSDLWFPDKTQSPERADEAKAICSGCPVRGVCLEYALSSGQAYGIWGGKTATEREKMT